MDQAWVLARRILTDQELQQALSAFTRWGIDVNFFEYTPQDECTGLP